MLAHEKKIGWQILHKTLLNRATAALQYIYDEWRSRKAVRPAAITWAGEPIKDDAGNHIDDAVLCLLPEDPALQHRALRDMVMRTSACALMLIVQEEQEVRAYFETAYGSRCWRFPIRYHGNVHVVGAPTWKDDENGVGIFWQTTKASA